MATKKNTKSDSAGEKIEGYLPVFTGFYGTIFEPQEDSVIEEPYTYDDYDFDYAKYNQDVAKECVGVVEGWLKNFDIKIKFQELISPKYYNYSNDSINVEYTIGKDTVKEILDYLEIEKVAFAKYIKDHYTSRSGFISSYSNDSADWIKDLKDGNKLHHVFGSVLEFILEQEGHDQHELYDRVSGNVFLSGKLNAKAIEREKEHEEFEEKVVEIARKGYAKKSQSEVVDAIVKHLEGKEADYDRGEIEVLVKKAYADIESQTASMFGKGGKAKKVDSGKYTIRYWETRKDYKRPDHYKVWEHDTFSKMIDATDFAEGLFSNKAYYGVEVVDDNEESVFHLSEEMKKGGKVLSGLKSFLESYSNDGGLIFGGYFSSKKDCGGMMEKGGKALTKYEFHVGDVVWDIGNKTYGVVMNNFDDPINGDSGDVRLDSDGMQSIYTYDKGYENRIGYNLVPYGSKEDKGDGDLSRAKKSGKGLIESNKERGDEGQYKYYSLIFCRLLSGEFDKKKSADKMEKGGISKDGDRHKYYIKAWKKEKDYNDEKKPDLEEKKSLNWDEAHERQMSLEESYYAVGIFAVKDNREVSISLGEFEKGGKAGSNKRVNIEVVVPKAKKSLLEDDAYELREFIVKSLTKEWFGHGAFDVETKKIADDKITLIVKIPMGKEYSVEDEFEFTEFLSKKLTKNWFGTGAFSVSIVK